MELVGAILLAWFTAGIAVVVILNGAKWLVRRHATPQHAHAGDAAPRGPVAGTRPLPRPLPAPAQPIAARSSLTRPVATAPEL